jgi:hypothetical protein
MRRGLQWSRPTATPIDTVPAEIRQEGTTVTTDTLDRIERVLLDLENLLAIATDALTCAGCRRDLAGAGGEVDDG